jgi:hypothetical protein
LITEIIYLRNFTSAQLGNIEPALTGRRRCGARFHDVARPADRPVGETQLCRLAMNKFLALMSKQSD